MSTEDNTVKVKEKEADPLCFVKFFDPSRVGVTVEAAAAGVKVTKAEEGKSFARAGLKVIDVIVGLDGKEANTPETFRRLLRTKLAEGGRRIVKVRRQGRAVEIPITCAD